MAFFGNLVDFSNQYFINLLFHHSDNKNNDILGNGDILGYEDYYNHIENDHVDGIMIGRGALVHYIKCCYY